MNNAQLINQDSGVAEWYTPEDVIEAARALMGGIDLDPASCATANRTVRASHYFTKEDNGLALPWRGRVWLNHPFGKPERACGPDCTKKGCTKRGFHLSEYRPGSEDWINKLIVEYREGRVSQAVTITFSNTGSGWFRHLLHFPQFYFTGRVEYVNPFGEQGDGVTKDSVITWLPPSWYGAKGPGSLEYWRAVQELQRAFGARFPGVAK